MGSKARSQILGAFFAVLIGPVSVPAQTYPIDCAILLCLAGGWPSSAPCARARAEFIRRITPWPIEPPLQIWRCPMGASFERDRDGPYSTPSVEVEFARSSSLLLQTLDILPLPPSQEQRPPALLFQNAVKEHALHLIQQRADIDIGGPEFDFVRSIRVYDVRYARQYEAGSEGECERSARLSLGTYGHQGAFSWRPVSIHALPLAHVGLEHWGTTCPTISHRSVFVDWRDYSGVYGFEQVDY